MMEVNRKTTIIRLHGDEAKVHMMDIVVTQGGTTITPVLNGYDEATEECDYADYIVQSGIPVTFDGTATVLDFLLLGKSLASNIFTFTPYGEVITIEARAV